MGADGASLGWPEREVGFEDILELARDQDGWGAVGHPEFGEFKLVHTNPEFSTSGLSAVVAEYYAASDKTEGLVEADIDGKARATVRDIERSIVHYGDTTLFVADQMRAEGPGYASAVAMEEATLLDFNRDRGASRSSSPSIRRRARSSPTIRSTSSTGDWVTPQQRDGAEAFQRFLAERISPEVAAQAGFSSGRSRSGAAAAGEHRERSGPGRAPGDAVDAVRRGACGHPQGMACRPKAGQRDGRGGRLGLDG